MRKLILLLSIVCIVGCEEKHTVKRVIDGDTIVLDNGKHIRILDIDSEERNTYFGQVAKRFADSVLKGKEVLIQYIGGKSYERKIARVLINGYDFSDLIVTAGLAHVDMRYCRNAQLLSEYDAAKARKIGIFSQAHYELPSHYRKSH